MSILHPYKRICRPFLHDNSYADASPSYVQDASYATDRTDLIRAYNLLEKFLYEIFNYVEPCDANANCYSHELYALLLRASTEFESNAKAIFSANKYTKTGNLKIFDYHKLNTATRLSEFEVVVPFWSGAKKSFFPLVNEVPVTHYLGIRHTTMPSTTELERFNMPL